jgi:hypothetical protein
MGNPAQDILLNGDAGIGMTLGSVATFFGVVRCANHDVALED